MVKAHFTDHGWHVCQTVTSEKTTVFPPGKKRCRACIYACWPAYHNRNSVEMG